MPVFDFMKDAKAADTGRKLTEIPVASIHRSPYQPRVTFDEESIAELAQSIRQVGLIQPLVVRKAPEGGYELVAGERRLRAVKSLGMEKVTCIVEQSVQDESSAMMALIENLQREDLHYLEEAQCYSTLLSTYNLTQEELAQRLGKSQSSIANKLRLLRLPEEVKTAMADAHLTERHARALLKLRDEKTQLELVYKRQLVDKVAKKSLSVKETEKLVDKTLNKLFDEKSDGARPRPRILRIVKDYRLFMNTINAAVNTLREAGMTVAVEQQDREDGVDIRISVTRYIAPHAKRGRS